MPRRPSARKQDSSGLCHGESLEPRAPAGGFEKAGEGAQGFGRSVTAALFGIERAGMGQHGSTMYRRERGSAKFLL